MKEFFSTLAQGFEDFCSNTGLEIILVVLLSLVVATYIVGLILMFISRLAKFNSSLKECNTALDGIQMVDKSNRRRFLGILNKAPVAIKKSWENYEYFKTGRAVDYFNRESILESEKGFGFSHAIFMMATLIFPVLMFLFGLASGAENAMTLASFYTLLVVLFEIVLYSIASFLRRQQAKAASVRLDYFLESIHIKANLYADIERVKVATQLRDDRETAIVTKQMQSRDSSTGIYDDTKVLNDNIVNKAMGNKGLSKSEKQAIANSIQAQKATNPIATKQTMTFDFDDKEIEKPKKPAFTIPSSPIDDVLLEINNMKSNGGSMKDIQRLIDVLQREKEKPNKTEEESKKINLALNELLQVLAKEKEKEKETNQFGY